MNAKDVLANLILSGEFILLGIGVPWVGMRMLAPSLVTSDRATVTNFRGRRVFLGLGVVWVFWVAAVALAPIAYLAVEWPADVELSLPAVLLGIAAALALAATCLGLIDDALGGGDERGFRGHFRAARRGRLSTGMLKLVGISLASLGAAFVVESIVGRTFEGGESPFPLTVVRVLLMGAGIALTSNLVNLADVRPGRALKVYALLALLGVLSTGLVALPQLEGAAGLAGLWTAVAFLLAFAVGPILAVWRFDLGEWGMLGDAGANPAGAVAGFLIVVGLPLWGVGVYTAVMLALNLASERWSFSAVIEKNRFLSWLDGLGRLPADTPTSDGIGDIKS